MILCRGAMNCALSLTTGNRIPGAMNRGVMNHAPTVGYIVRAFKARCTYAVNQKRDTSGLPLWQRNYYEHIIRNEPELNKIREYIINNPLNWEQDENFA